MHKLKLSTLNLSDAEVLTREQLKKILGGDGSGGSGGICQNECSSDNDCKGTTIQGKNGPISTPTCERVGCGGVFAYICMPAKP